MLKCARLSAEGGRATTPKSKAKAIDAQNDHCTKSTAATNATTATTGTTATNATNTTTATNATNTTNAKNTTNATNATGASLLGLRTLEVAYVSKESFGASLCIAHRSLAALVPAAKRLERLTLRGQPLMQRRLGLAPPYIAALRGLSCLRELCLLSVEQLSRDCWKCLSGLPLSRLELGVRIPSWKQSEFADSLALLLPTLPTLTSLCLFALQLTQPLSRALDALPALRELSLRGCLISHVNVRGSQLLSAAPEAWARLTHLTLLDLTDCCIDDTIVYPLLQRTSSLRELRLPRCVCTDKALESIGRMASLHCLQLVYYDGWRPGLTKDEFGPGLSLNGFHHLRALPALQRLCIWPPFSEAQQRDFVAPGAHVHLDVCPRRWVGESSAVVVRRNVCTGAAKACVVTRTIACRNSWHCIDELECVYALP